MIFCRNSRQNNELLINKYHESTFQGEDFENEIFSLQKIDLNFLFFEELKKKLNF